jgi:hypothetical protein
MGTPMSEVRSPIPASPVLPGVRRESSGFEDDGRRWAPRSGLLIAGGVSLVVWGALAFIAAAVH